MKTKKGKGRDADREWRRMQITLSLLLYLCALSYLAILILGLLFSPFL